MDRPEHLILLACARPANDPERAEMIRRGVASGLDWEYLLRAASAHRLTSLLYWHLNLACREAVPAPVLARLRDEFAANAASNLLLTARLRQILGLFERAGIRAIPYKGPALAHAIYEDPGAREFDDLDILVPRAEAFRAVALLGELGYLVPRPHSPRVQAEILKREHHVHVGRADGTASVEIHWTIVNDLPGPPLPIERWWERARDAEQTWRPASAGRVPSAPVRSLSPEDLLVALCVHGAFHMWMALRWVADVARLLERGPALDWEYVWREHHPDVQRMLALGLLVAHDAAAAPVPGANLDRARQDPEACALARQVAERLFEPGPNTTPGLALCLRFLMRLRTRRADRLASVLRVALAPTVLEWDVRLPPALFPLYFALRPFRLAAKYARRLVDS